MSDTCGNCSCADKNQCVKKGNTVDIIPTEKSYLERDMIMDGPVLPEEHDGKCKCGSSCACTNCACAH